MLILGGILLKCSLGRGSELQPRYSRGSGRYNRDSGRYSCDSCSSSSDDPNSPVKLRFQLPTSLSLRPLSVTCAASHARCRSGARRHSALLDRTWASSPGAHDPIPSATEPLEPKWLRSLSNVVEMLCYILFRRCKHFGRITEVQQKSKDDLFHLVKAVK